LPLCDLDFGYRPSAARTCPAWSCCSSATTPLRLSIGGLPPRLPIPTRESAPGGCHAASHRLCSILPQENIDPAR